MATKLEIWGDEYGDCWFSMGRHKLPAMQEAIELFEIECTSEEDFEEAHRSEVSHGYVSYGFVIDDANNDEAFVTLRRGWWRELLARWLLGADYITTLHKGPHTPPGFTDSQESFTDWLKRTAAAGDTEAKEGEIVGD